MTACQNSKGLLAISSAHFFLLWILARRRRVFSELLSHSSPVDEGTAVLEWTSTSSATSAALQLEVFSMDHLPAQIYLSEGPDWPEREAVDSLPSLVNCTITRLTGESGMPRFWVIWCWLTPPSKWSTIRPLWKSESLCVPWVWGIVNCHTRPRNSFLQRNSWVLVKKKKKKNNHWVKLALHRWN